MNITSNLTVGEYGVRVGVLMYSDEVYSLISLTVSNS